MIKQKSGRELDREKSRGKKRYIERVIQENEADKEIKEFELDEPIEYPERELGNRNSGG